MREIFNPNRTAPIRHHRRRTGRIITCFFVLVTILFGLSFIISYNIFAAKNKPNVEAVAKVTELTQINEELMAEIESLRSQLNELNSATPNPTSTPQPSSTPKPSPTKAPTPKPTPTKAPTPAPTPTPVVIE